MDNPDQSIIRRDVLNMVWPFTVERVLQFAVGIVSTGMVGRIGAVAIATVGLSMRITSWVWVLSQAVTVGATVLVARAVGAENRERAAEVAMQSLLLTLAITLTLAVVAVVFAGPLIALFPGEPELLESATMYLRIVAWSMPLQGVMLSVGAVLRGAGDTKTPMYVAVVVNIVNIIASYALIFGNLGFPALGLRGSALAMILAQAAGCTAALIALFKTHTLPVDLGMLRSLRTMIMRDVLRIGLPASAESSFWQAATFILTILIVSLDTVPMAAHQVGITAEGMSYMPATALGVAATAFVGQALGAQRPHLGKRYMHEVIRWGSMLAALVTVLLVAIPRLMLRLLTNDTAVIELGAYYLIFMGVIQIPQILTWVFNGALRGSGDTRSPMWFAAVGIWLIRLPFAYIFSRYLGWGILGVWAAMMVDIVVRFILSFWRYRQGRWQDPEEVQLDSVAG